jgi:selenide,water dikinase
MPRELALVGGGHAHIEVVRRWGLAPVADTRLTVFDPNPRPIYSGMVPGYIAGQYQRHELEIDLPALCHRVGARFVQATVTKVQPDQLHLADAASFRFDLASLDIGSTVAGTNSPGVREFALPSRPIGALCTRITDLIDTTRSGDALHIVGGGAGGIEVAFCLDARLRAAGATGSLVTIVSSEPVVFQHSPVRVRIRVERALARRGIGLRTGSRVASIDEKGLVLESGEILPSSGTLWVTGPAAHPLAAESGLPVDERGFVRSEPDLRIQGEQTLFAVGDCASLPGMQKAGVYAVRAGPLLEHNLRAVLLGDRLHEYTPQRDFLSLLNLGDGTAIGSKWGVAIEGRAMMKLKDRIDRAFMQKYR